ncbi:MAG TPA: cyclic nucleotide-binding domain-containing protein [Chloroflexota bacterium]|nr:cyclic nucleotide-binding domain-containing protein [Chloroflexota bacterium]
MNLEDSLVHVDLFAGMDRKHLRKLAEKMKVVTYAPGDTVMRSGTAPPRGGLANMGVVLKGALDVEGPDGQSVARIGPGQVFGEMALLDDSERSATIVAVEPTEAALLSAFNFRRELETNQAFTLNMLKVLVQRIREARSTAPR